MLQMKWLFIVNLNLNIRKNSTMWIKIMSFRVSDRNMLLVGFFIVNTIARGIGGSKKHYRENH